VSRIKTNQFREEHALFPLRACECYLWEVNIRAWEGRWYILQDSRMIVAISIGRMEVTR
jgi:hypothetical protein